MSCPTNTPLGPRKTVDWSAARSLDEGTTIIACSVFFEPSEWHVGLFFSPSVFYSGCFRCTGELFWTIYALWISWIWPLWSAGSLRITDTAERNHINFIHSFRRFIFSSVPFLLASVLDVIGSRTKLWLQWCQAWFCCFTARLKKSHRLKCVTYTPAGSSAQKRPSDFEMSKFYSCIWGPLWSTENQRLQLRETFQKSRIWSGGFLESSLGAGDLLTVCWLFKENTNHQVPLLTKLNYLSHTHM